MRTIRDDLRENEIDQIIEALKNDGFENISKQPSSINFNKGYRNFELISTDINAEDMGIRIDFNKDILFENENKNESHKYFKLKSYQEKTRHSTSFSKTQSQFLDEEQSINAIDGWEMIESHNIGIDDAWKAAIHTPTIYHVKIHGKDHVIINEKVYEGTPDIYLSMGKIDIETFFKNTQLVDVLTQLNQE